MDPINRSTIPTFCGTTSLPAELQYCQQLQHPGAPGKAGHPGRTGSFLASYSLPRISRYRYLVFNYISIWYVYKCACEEISLSVCISTCLCRVTYASPLLHQFIRQLVWYISSIVSWNSGILRHTHAILKSQKFAHHSLVLHVGQNLGDTVNRRLQQSDFESRECLDRYKALARLPRTTLSKFVKRQTLQSSDSTENWNFNFRPCHEGCTGSLEFSGIICGSSRDFGPWSSNYKFNDSLLNTFESLEWNWQRY